MAGFFKTPYEQLLKLAQAQQTQNLYNPQLLGHAQQGGYGLIPGGTYTYVGAGGGGASGAVWGNSVQEAPLDYKSRKVGEVEFMHGEHNGKSVVWMRTAATANRTALDSANWTALDRDEIRELVQGLLQEACL